MPTRVLRDGYLGSERVASLRDPGAEVLYFRLYFCADDYGRFDARPRYVLRSAFPVHDHNKDVTEAMVQKWLLKLATSRLILLYTVAGREYLYIAKFDQRLRSMKSKYPAPPDNLVADIDTSSDDQLKDSDTDAPTPAAAPVLTQPNAAAEKRRLQREAAIRALDYLNAKAGTKYQPVDGTLKWPMARLNGGATEDQMRAVIDAKVAEVAKGDFKREWLQPSTIFNDTKYAQYVGKLKLGSMETASSGDATHIMVRGSIDGKPGAWLLAQKEMLSHGDESTAKEIAQAFWASDPHRQRTIDHGCTRISIKVPGEIPVEFTVAQLEAWKNGN